jgi:hypothetical protein
MLLISLYWIDWHGNAQPILLIPVEMMQSLRNQKILTNLEYIDDPVGNFNNYNSLMRLCDEYSESCFGRFENDCNIFRVRSGNKFIDLKMIDLKPYSPGRTGRMDFIVQHKLQGKQFNNLLTICAIIPFIEFVGIQIDRYLCTTTRLWVLYHIHQTVSI